MAIKILQTNVERSHAAQDMAYSTAKKLDVDLMVVGKPNKKRVNKKHWLKYIRTYVVVLLLNRNIGLSKHETYDKHLTLNF